ncbi:MAG: hypothetical protein ACLRXP_17985 [Oscillospiraceae bacterium]
MMKHISVTDTTIRQAGKAAGYTLSFREKIELAKLLDRLGVSVIELHAVENPKIDSLLIKSVASAVKESAVCVPVALDPASVSLVWAALRETKHPRIQVPAPVSAVQMEYPRGQKARRHARSDPPDRRGGAGGLRGRGIPRGRRHARRSRLPR